MNRRNRFRGLLSGRADLFYTYFTVRSFELERLRSWILKFKFNFPLSVIQLTTAFSLQRRRVCPWACCCRRLLRCSLATKFGRGTREAAPSSRSTELPTKWRCAAEWNIQSTTHLMEDTPAHRIAALSTSNVSALHNVFSFQYHVYKNLWQDLSVYRIFNSRTHDSTPCRVGPSVPIFFNCERISYYSPCPAVRDCLTEYPALFSTWVTSVYLSKVRYYFDSRFTTNNGQKKTGRCFFIKDCSVTKKDKPLKSMMVSKSFEISFIWALTEHCSFRTLEVMML